MNEKSGNNASKLKTSTTAAKAARDKFRTGKKDNEMTLEERKALAKMRSQGRTWAYKEIAAREMARKAATATRAVSSGASEESKDKNQDQNVGAESLRAGLSAASAMAEAVKHDLYSNKRYENKHKRDVREENAAKKSGSNPQSKARQHSQMKKEIKEKAFQKSSKEAANQVGNVGRKFVDQAEDLVGKLGEFLKEHAEAIGVIAVVLALIILISGIFSSCGCVFNGASHVGITTSYTAVDDEILAVEANYRELEDELKDTIDNIEVDHPGFDEYQYTLDNIGHNPYQLAAVLTVLYEQYTESMVQAKIEEIFEKQYTLTLRPVTEIREREVTDYRWVEDDSYEDGGYYEEYTYIEQYEWKILKVSLVNHTLDTVIRSLGLTADQLARYEVLLETYGNKKYLFDDDIYSIVDPGRYGDYEIPPEALTDVRFANMIREAERYLGYPYVWGGSKPSTSFDCSGFVCWVINHCGNGWNVGRTTANGLLNRCTRIPASEARPGDLIFFKGTYDVKGASHVGIYVGDGMMLHCGSPIQYTSVNTNYWKKHFYTYARING